MVLWWFMWLEVYKKLFMGIYWKKKELEIKRLIVRKKNGIGSIVEWLKFISDYIDEIV